MNFNAPTTKRKLWKPPALRAPVLIVTVLVCWGLIAVLQYLLVRSQRDSGIIFAPNINDLPLSKTFLYLYFPTIIAVIFSIYWAWIDLEAKRMEPYYQLSKENGALGKDSLLLHYPFDFIPWVPFKAMKDRHWPVFWASLAVVLVTWGLVPTQAGIFSVRSVTRITNGTFSMSTSGIPIALQASNLTLRYTQSTYGIISLDETLPAFMARNYTLSPFKKANGINFESAIAGEQGTWTADVTMYSLDMFCEDASHKADNSKAIFYTSNNGCNFTLGPTGNLTVGEDIGSGSGALGIRQYTGQYAGYWNHEGFADYSLDAYCPETANHTFFAGFSKSKEAEEDPPNNVTAIYCTPTYYQQPVSATVDMKTKAPVHVRTLGAKQPLAPDLFNTSTFEELLNAGSLGMEVRGDILPAKSMPKYLEPLAKTNISLTSGGGGIVQGMVGMAVGVDNLPLESYLDWKILSKSYADAYRLVFARAMVEVLDTNFQSSRNITGECHITTEAVVLEAVFVYIVEGFLGVVSLATLALLYLSITRSRNLRTNPSTIASVMAIVADNEPLLSEFADLDCCTTDDIQNIVGHKRFKLTHDETQTGIVEIADVNDLAGQVCLPTLLSLRRDTPSDIAQPIRPREFSLWVAFPFVNLFVVLAIVLGVLNAKAHANGLPLPSSNTIVQNLLENYIPTAIATLVEPMWILINRLLCMLQPLEELRGCNATAKISIDLNYSSLPPQLVAFKALKSRHFVLAAVCTMALLANVLAVAFAGLFNQSLATVFYPTSMFPPYELKFVPINGSVGPISGRQFGSLSFSGAYLGGNGEDQFLVAESNFTRGTPLPTWTDDAMFYFPFFGKDAVLNTSSSNTTHFEASIKAFGAQLDCTKLELGNNFEAALTMEDTFLAKAHINITVPKDSENVRCSSRSDFSIRPGPNLDQRVCVTGPAALELVLQLHPRTNATQSEIETCMLPLVMGWVRDPKGSCPLGRELQLTKENSLFIQCQPRLVTGSAKVRVDASGRLVQRAEGLTTETVRGNNQQLFSNDPINLIGQSNLYMFKADDAGWHNDSFASDFMNYFTRRASNSTRLIDPDQSVPTFNDAVGPLNKAYSNLFAIWLGTNKDLLLVPSEKNSSLIAGSRVESEQRLFVSTTMFVISEAILCTYVIVAIFVYLRRPGQYLARLPTSIASLLPMFAASSAVYDLKNTSHLDAKGRARHLESLDSRYGYGNYVGGGDGRVHIGIEKTTFLRVRTKTSWLEKRIPLFRKSSRDFVD